MNLLCKLFGHKWRTFDANWCGKDYQMCQRMGLHLFRMCGVTREIDTPLSYYQPSERAYEIERREKVAEQIAREKGATR